MQHEWLRKQIAAYAKERRRYEKYADVLLRILKAAARDLAPMAIVQARAKAIPSFAFKANKKRTEHPDPVKQFTDLCGARIITHTQAEAERICAFIKRHFIIDEANSQDVLERLRPSEFGYRSVRELAPLLCRTANDDNLVNIGKQFTIDNAVNLLPRKAVLV